MAGKVLRPLIVRPAPRGSKKGWVPVVAKLPPETVSALAQLEDRRPAFRGDLVREAVERLLKSEGLLAA